MEKCEKTHTLGHFRVNVPVQFELGTSSVLVIFDQLVPVHVRLVPVQPVPVFLFQPVFVFWS